jgi:putative DNA primase/helicase
MMVPDNIIKLAKLNGVLPPTAEDAIALLFAERHADALRYVAIWGQWLSFEETVWQSDDTLHAFDLVREVCREIAADCDKAAVAAVERLAKADRRLAAVAGQWDVVDWFVNTGEEP